MSITGCCHITTFKIVNVDGDLSGKQRKRGWVFFLLGSLLEFTTLAYYELTMWYVDVVSVSCFLCWF